MPHISNIAHLVTPHTTNIIPTWTIEQVRAALLVHRTGDFSLVSQLFDSMLEDDELPGTVQKRVNATLRSKFRLSIDGTDRDLTEREKKIEKAFPSFAPSAELFDLLANWIILGVGVATLDWDTSTPGIWIPKLRTLPTEYLRYDTGERQWVYEAQEGSLIVTPGDGRWVLLTTGQRGWIWGLIRGLAVLWLSKALTQGDWSRYNERHGLPIVKAFTPITSDKDEREKFIDALAELRSEAVIGLPRDESGFGYDVELMEAMDRSWESFMKSIERADRKMQVMLLGGNLGTEVATTGANRAASEVHVLTLDREKAKIDSDRLSRTLQEQLLAPFMALNFPGENEIPAPQWDVAPAEDVRLWVDAQGSFLDMLGKQEAAGYDVANAEALATEYGLRLKKLKTAATPKPDAKPAAQRANDRNPRDT